jgi:hypothetical protein
MAQAGAEGGRVRRGGGRGAANQVNHYHQMLGRMGFDNAAILALENLGLDHIQTFTDITEKDIPSIVKELRRTGTIVWQTAQNYLHAL